VEEGEKEEWVKEEGEKKIPSPAPVSTRTLKPFSTKCFTFPGTNATLRGRDVK